MGEDPGVTSLIVPTSFHGPPDSANGGWAAGALAALIGSGGALGRTVEVTLRLPPPLEVPLEVGEHEGAWRALDAEARETLGMLLPALGRFLDEKVDSSAIDRDATLPKPHGSDRHELDRHGRDGCAPRGVGDPRCSGDLSDAARGEQGHHERQQFPTDVCGPAHLSSLCPVAPLR